jgi:hypothetical protein
MARRDTLPGELPKLPGSLVYPRGRETYFVLNGEMHRRFALTPYSEVYRNALWICTYEPLGWTKS